MPDFSWKIIIMTKSQKTQSVNFWNLQETFSKHSTANEHLSPQQTLWQCVSDCPWFNISCILVPYILKVLIYIKQQANTCETLSFF